ncbi:hypothetical protein [Arthrobacter sp. FW306-2-2C-D06B]|uniref:hypothetical protein n=1 Tax=Arthrobacter sp. FW306-2-2C-D06B TaxID=2879618 RepID=UPI001F3A9DCE|nr:hypothetical protein [Arthrobacter sp. FW306-2-2C-D06B]UKA59178.1 hypothetical protein LFT47_02140 [Arthrobacter sp. FW306-2-2C-D06B]
MTKFKLGDHVRVTDPRNGYFDQVGRITTIDKSDVEGLPYRVTGLSKVTPLWLGPHELTLADPEQEQP